MMPPILLKKELEEIWNWLKGEITPEDRKWLKKHRPVHWYKITEFPRPEIAWALTMRIKEVLDAKSGRTKVEFASELLKSHLFELAQMLGIAVPKNATKRSMVNLILNKIISQRIEGKTPS